MDSEPHDQNWETLSQEILTGMREWRLAHPKATLREIEVALDEHLSRLRARMLQDVALQSVAAVWKVAASPQRPTCRLCSTPLILRGHGQDNRAEWQRARLCLARFLRTSSYFCTAHQDASKMLCSLKYSTSV